MDPYETFLAACETNHFSDWLRVLEAGLFDINDFQKHFPFGWTPLHVAVEERNFNMVKLLLEKGEDIRVRVGGVHNGVTALDKAIDSNNLEMVNLLLEYYGTEDTTDEAFRYAIDPLSNAIGIKSWSESKVRVSKSIVITLCKREIDRLSIRSRRDDHRLKYYCLCKAIVEGDIETAGAIVDSLESVKFSGIENCYQPLHFTIMFHRNELIAPLLAKDNATLWDIVAAVCARNSQAISLCLDNIDNEDKCPEIMNDILGFACSEGFLDAVKILIAQGWSLPTKEYVARASDPETPETRMVLKYLLDTPDPVIGATGCPVNLIEYANPGDCGEDGSVYALLLEYGADPNFPKMEELSTHYFCQFEGECHVLRYYRRMSLVDADYVMDRIWTLGLGQKDWAYLTSKDTPKYEKELAQLRKIKLNVSTSLIPTWSLFDIMVIEPIYLARLVRNINLQRILRENNCDFRKSFPSYGTILNIKYKKAWDRRNMIDLASDLLREALGCHLTEEILDYIFKNFTNNQLSKWKLDNLE